jgi:hypothetical protein
MITVEKSVANVEELITKKIAQKDGKKKADKTMPRNALKYLIQFELERQAPLLFSKLMAENGITLAANFN